MPSPPAKPPPPPPPSLTSLLETLVEAGVELILVGGLAAVAQGAPIATFDVDVVHRRTPDNLERLNGFLDRVHARYRGRKSSPIPIDRAALAGPGHSLFSTDLGPLDVLGTVGLGLDYDALLSDTVEIELGGGRLKILSLAAIVRQKRASQDPKDRLALPVLEETLRRSGGDV